MRSVVVLLAAALLGCASTSAKDIKQRPAIGPVGSTFPALEIADCLARVLEEDAYFIGRDGPIQIRPKPSGFDVISGGDYGVIYALVDVTENASGSLITGYVTPSLLQGRSASANELEKMINVCA